MRQGPAGVPPRVPEGRPGTGRAGQGRRGRRVGPRRCPPAPRRASRVHPEYNGVHRRASSRSTAGRRPSAGRSATAYTGPRVTKVVCAVDVGLRRQPARPGGADDGRHHGRHRAGPDARACTCKDGHFLEGSWDNYFYTRQWNTPPDLRDHRHAADHRQARRRGRARRRGVDGGGRLRLRARDRHHADAASRSTTATRSLRAAAHRAADPRSPRPTASTTPTEEPPCRTTPSSSTARRSPSTSPDDVRLLWVLRDLLGVTGPKYGCGIEVCKACTSHINGKAFNPCAVPVARHRARTTRSPPSRASPTPCDAELHPMQEAWLEHDVAQCGYCQPGQIMTAVATVRQAARGGPRDRRRRPRRDPQHLPLRHLQPHPRGHQGAATKM